MLKLRISKWVADDQVEKDLAAALESFKNNKPISIEEEKDSESSDDLLNMFACSCYPQ